MKQLTQKLKDGILQVVDVPQPNFGFGEVLVKNYYSLVSTGTESSSVTTARKSLLGKAKERPQQVKQVLDSFRQQGVKQTFHAVNKKLQSFSPLGYSCAGEVIGIGDDVRNLKVGDFVACGGITANHAEVVSVPQNLCVKLDINRLGDFPTQLKAAAYNTLGAIALQGVRQADLRLGETCAVIGLGLLGQLTCQLLRASGVRVVGTDIDSNAVDMAAEYSADIALLQSDPSVAEKLEHFSGGLGVDAVIITAASSSTTLINFAGQIVRKRGRVVIVGAVPTGFDRDPYFYRKELEVRMSCSYGPGRYDPTYEEHGIDYPIAYVRWTERRNMEAFQYLVQNGAVNTSALSTHCVSLENAPTAYDMIIGRSEPFVGVLIEYDFEKPNLRQPVILSESVSACDVNLAFIGAGSYAQGSLLPNLPRDTSIVTRKAVLTHSGITSRGVAERFGFEMCVTDIGEIISNDDINTVFISTRHDSHAEYVLDCLRAGKNVFVEKPLCLSLEELEEIEEVFNSLKFQPQLMVGFNRRFAPLAKYVKKLFGSGPMAMAYRINAGAIASDHWIQDAKIGGGRIIGEVCHFIDFLTFINGSLPDWITATALPDPHGFNDTLSISLSYENGSIGNILYAANGSSSMPKERFELFRAGMSGVIEDFRYMEVFSEGRPLRKKLKGQDKGQTTMVHDFIGCLKPGGKCLIDPREIYSASRASFAICDSLKYGSSINLQTF